MATNLTNAAALYKATAFRDKVRAAMTEVAVTALGDNTGDYTANQTRKAVARSVIADPSRLLDVFTGICADDAAISQTADPAAVLDEDIRRVVSTRWNPIGSSIPNVGA